MSEKADLSALAAIPDTDLLIVGARQGMEDEDRFDAVRVGSRPKRCLRFVRSCTHRSHIFDFILNGHEIETAVSWSQVGSTIRKHFGPGPGNVVLDITTLELESLLYLFPALITLGPRSLHAAYAMPRTYRQEREKEADVFAIQEIQQPKGYVTFPGDLEENSASRVFLLGFDRGRAQKFILKYNWPDEELWPVIGEPAFIENGTNHALEANAELVETAKARLIRLPVESAADIRAFLSVRFDRSQHLDIIPIGPKPWLLGAVQFYFSLPQDERHRVRFLFDFPSPRPSRTSGVQRVVVYDCGFFL